MSPGKYEGPIVFEGNAPADIRENHELSRILASRPSANPAAARIWLGAPNSIKGPTEVVFQKQSGSHLLIAGQREETAATMLGLSAVALAAQFPTDGARIFLLHAAPEETPEAKHFAQIAAKIPGLTVSDPAHITEMFSEIATDLRARLAGESPANAPRIFVLIHGLQKFKKLRGEDDFSFSSDDSESPAKQLTSIITEGAAQGIHLIASIDSFNNVNRFLNRKTLSEIEMRVVFQMSASDSASLIDTPKASNLGLHRALLHNEQAGTLETFRPYAAPDSAWLAAIS
jgi:DNA segregation ATPase FtsK/SpoIIIE, S-DNA-T family